MVLAQKQTHRPTEQNRYTEIKLQLQIFDKVFMKMLEKKASAMVSKKVDIHMPKTETRPLSLTI
jgi:hypothetical protein